MNKTRKPKHSIFTINEIFFSALNWTWHAKGNNFFYYVKSNDLMQKFKIYFCLMLAIIHKIFEGNSSFHVK